MPVLLSVLERIARASGGVTPPPATTDDLRGEVVRHLEWVFNSRRGTRVWESVPNQSILAYGLPDFRAAGVDELEIRTRIEATLKEAVESFEPRLFDTEVTVESSVDKDFRMRIHVKAMLRVEPDPQPFLVETRLDLATRGFVVGRGNDAPDDDE